MIDINGSTKLLRQPFDKHFPCFSNSSIVSQIGLQTIALDKIGIIALTVYMLFNAAENLVDAVTHIGHCLSDKRSLLHMLTYLIGRIYHTFYMQFTW